MDMKFKNFIISPIAGENCYLVKRDNGNESWEVKVIYHYVTGYEVDVDIVGSVDIELINPKFKKNGKLRNNPPVGPLKQMFMALAMYDSLVSACNSN